VIDLALIEIRDITRQYAVGDSIVKALDGVSLDVMEHSFTAIIGPSGSGKSTLMNIIGCLDKPTSGSYKLNGQSISDLDGNGLSELRNKTIGFIFQKFNLLPRMTALENVELPLVYSGVPGHERRLRAEAELEAMGLADRMYHKPSELSGGQQQRVAIARALITEPALILADEPTGNLDSKTGREVLHMLERLYSGGKTIVLITHDSSVARRAKRVISIMDGKITSAEEVEAYAERLEDKQ
jgi:putative ABC transport system ATP-binding protein